MSYKLCNLNYSRYFLIAFFFLFSLSFTTEVEAKKFRIITVVNGQTISNFDLFNRSTMLINSSGMEDTEEVRTQMAGQVLRQMIDETLQKQHAKDIGIKVSDKEFERTLNDLETKNKIENGKFRDFIRGQGINEQTILDQIKTQLLWKKIVARKIRPQISISDYEISDTISQASLQKGNTEVYLSEIVLPLHADNAADTQQLADKLVQELRDSGSFSSIARQFSSGITAEKDGVIGWVAQSQLRSPLKEAVVAADQNTILDPIASDESLRIVKVGNRRNNNPLATEERVSELLMMRKTDLATQQYMTKLRNDAFIEIRM